MLDEPQRSSENLHSSAEFAGESRAQQTFAEPLELSVTFRVCSSMVYHVVAQVETCWRLWTSTELRRSTQTRFSSEEHHCAKGRWERPLGFGGAQWSLVQLSRARWCLVESLEITFGLTEFPRCMLVEMRPSALESSKRSLVEYSKHKKADFRWCWPKITQKIWFLPTRAANSIVPDNVVQIYVFLRTWVWKLDLGLPTLIYRFRQPKFEFGVLNLAFEF